MSADQATPPSGALSSRAPSGALPAPQPLDPETLSRAELSLRRATREVGRAFVSAQQHAELIMIALIARGHVLLEGVPGVAKTTLASSVAKVCACPMKRVQFTPDLLPADIIGGAIYHPQRQSFEVHKGPIFTHILLADELNRAPAKTQSALLEAMQEAQVSLEGETYPLPEPFFTLATQNPQAQTGVYQLPEAQLDRFALKLVIGYPDERDELKMLEAYQREPPQLTPLLSPELICGLQRAAEQVYVHPEVSAYIVKLTRATRLDPRVTLGASPRASLALLKLCKARALSRARPFVSPDDVIALAPHALAHRLHLQDEHKYAGLSARRVISELFKRVRYDGPELPDRPERHLV